jgi:acyl-CoA reductase-like NAD-dependent aldehyde dehydrogenase
MAAWKLAPALACGNTCVLKPGGDDEHHRDASRADLPGS